MDAGQLTGLWKERDKNGDTLSGRLNRISSILVMPILLTMILIGSLSEVVWAQIEQERCVRWGTEFFYREFKSTEGSLGGVPASFARIYCRTGDPCNFQSHYNKKLNKCFILVEIQGTTGKALPRGAVRVHLQYFLYDAYERIPYGVYEAKYDGEGGKVTTSGKVTTNCWVKDKFVSTLGKIPACQYEHEFLEAIRPFLEE